MRILARVYDAHLPADVVSAPTVRAGCEHSYHQYVVRSRRRDALREHLQREDIATAVHYPQPVHLQPAYRGRLRQIGSLHATEQACREIVSLPMYPQLPVVDVERVCAAVARAR